jgi:hypothetical protein
MAAKRKRPARLAPGPRVKESNELRGLPKNQLRLLLIEDDAHDLFFTGRALKKAGFPPPSGNYRTAPPPSAIFGNSKALPAAGRT